MKNPYLPIPMTVRRAQVETTDRMLRTLELSFVNEEDEQAFRYTPVNSVSSPSLERRGSLRNRFLSYGEGSLKFTINKAGVVTTALHQLEEGEEVGIRGPLGILTRSRSLKGRTCSSSAADSHLRRSGPLSSTFPIRTIDRGSRRSRWSTAHGCRVFCSIRKSSPSGRKGEISGSS